MRSTFHGYYYIILYYITYHLQFNLLYLFKHDNYKNDVVGKEMSKEPHNDWICQETKGKAKRHGRAENRLFLGHSSLRL